MATMDVDTTNHTLCLFEWIGFEYCLGEGLGHSIAYFFRGEIKSSFSANFMGPIAVFVLSFRILLIWKTIFKDYKDNKMGTNYV